MYLGDATERELFMAEDRLAALSLSLGAEELPDVVAYNSVKNWLFLIEAVTTSGPMSEERVLELRKLASESGCDLIFVTAFFNRADFRKWVNEIAWETEVWVADSPDHLIHFNGSKFLGPFRSSFSV